jgi:hypothetical protein
VLLSSVMQIVWMSYEKNSSVCVHDSMLQTMKSPMSDTQVESHVVNTVRRYECIAVDGSDDDDDVPVVLVLVLVLRLLMMMAIDTNRSFDKVLQHAAPTTLSTIGDENCCY